jgi:hypothetical protein
MNRAQVVRADPTAKGVKLRIWVDDEQGHHLTVAECELSALLVANIVVGIEKEQEQADQYQLAFDD